MEQNEIMGLVLLVGWLLSRPWLCTEKINIGKVHQLRSGLLSHCWISWTYWPGISSWSGCGEFVIDQDSWRACYGIGGGDGACYKPINMVTSVLLFYGRIYSTVPVWPLVITHCGWFVSLYPHVVHNRFNGVQYDEFCDYAVSSKFSQESGVELPMSKGSVWLLRRRRRKCA